MPGGRDALIARLDAADQAFVRRERVIDAGWYPLHPYVRLMERLARLQRQPVRAFMLAQSIRAAQVDIAGVYKPMLPTASPKRIAARVHLAFNRYFRPASARPVRVRDEVAEYELQTLPDDAIEFFRGLNEGFVRGALMEAGATKIELSYGPARAQAPGLVTQPFHVSFEQLPAGSRSQRGGTPRS